MSARTMMRLCVDTESASNHTDQPHGVNVQYNVHVNFALDMYGFTCKVVGLCGCSHVDSVCVCLVCVQASQCLC